MRNNLFIIFIIIFLYYTLPNFLPKIFFWAFWIAILSTIGLFAFVPVAYSPNIYLNKPGKFLSMEIWKKHISVFSTITYYKYITPVFYINGIVYDQNLLPVRDYDDITQLISIDGSDNMLFIKAITDAHKCYLNINNIYIIDNRRCRTEFIFNNRIIIVDFPPGIPEVEYFLYINKNYNLHKKFNYVDLRYKKFIICKNK